MADNLTDWKCTGGHDRCYGGVSRGPECPYCEPVYDMPCSAPQATYSVEHGEGGIAIAAAASPDPGPPKRANENGPDWRVLLPDQLVDAIARTYSLHSFAEDMMNFLKIPQWRRYDAIAYAYSAGKALLGDKMTFGIFMDRLRACKTSEPHQVSEPGPITDENDPAGRFHTKEVDYLGEINAMVEGK